MEALLLLRVKRAIPLVPSQSTAVALLSILMTFPRVCKLHILQLLKHTQKVNSHAFAHDI